MNRRPTSSRAFLGRAAARPTPAVRPAPAYLTGSAAGRRGWPLAFAHRGADRLRENTLAAFRAAHEAGFAHLELDVRTTADGELVVVHDERLDRVAAVPGRLADRAWPDLTEVRVGGEPLLRLTDLLAALPEARLNIDLKDRASAPAMARLLAERSAADPGVWDRVLVASFHDSRRRAFRRALVRLGHAGRAHGPRRVATSGGAAAIAALVLLGPLGLTGWLRRHTLDVDCVQVPLRWGRVPVATAGFLRRCHAAGLPVHVWVVDEPAEMARLVDLGVDGLMTDDAGALAAVLAARGAWPQQ